MRGLFSSCASMNSHIRFWADVIRSPPLGDLRLRPASHRFDWTRGLAIGELPHPCTGDRTCSTGRYLSPLRTDRDRTTPNQDVRKEEAFARPHRIARPPLESASRIA